METQTKKTVMKRLKNIYISIGLIVCMLLANSCDKSIENFYKGKGRVQFKYYTLDYNKKMIFNKKSTFSFGMLPDEKVTDTAKIVVEYLGSPEDRDRTYRVKIFTDSTTALEGTHFLPFDAIQTIKAGKLNDTLRIVVLRNNLSTSFTNPQDMRLELELEPTDDFDLGMKDGLRRSLYINNYLSEPKWWKEPLIHDNVGFYHPKKWRILISFNSQFANYESCPFNVNNEGREYFRGLDNYLKSEPTFDDETGARIYIDKLVPVETNK